MTDVNWELRSDRSNPTYCHCPPDQECARHSHRHKAQDRLPSDFLKDHFFPKSILHQKIFACKCRLRQSRYTWHPIHTPPNALFAFWPCKIFPVKTLRRRPVDKGTIHKYSLPCSLLCSLLCSRSRSLSVLSCVLSSGLSVFSQCSLLCSLQCSFYCSPKCYLKCPLWCSL